ncbi:hypothetical protein [Ichthyenterobacterium magnum]|uniref:Lipoprotein n=1 Tax=Ichthyenterobacterium magnum TaxID=1230530 RepID=A0A420DEA2_9FLAO|nr:hypothetical protein [Ichthyenterobacterium magnum]RKE90255.1 hypothetical protein BXY80_2722 [Ichthyenterobacterium magnum]
MNKSIIILLLILTIVSCQKKEKNKPIAEQTKTEKDTTKTYRVVNYYYDNDKDIREEYEVYVSKEKDTFWNQVRYFKNGILDNSRSKHYVLKISGKKTDSFLKGTIRFYSPADSVPDSKIHSRNVIFTYLQEVNDSLIHEEIRTDKNIIEFDYKNYGNLSFEGHISDLRFIKIDSTPEKLNLNRNYFAIDTEVWTNNTFVELLK